MNFYRFTIALLLILIFVGCKKPAEPVVASLNGQKILLPEFKKRIHREVGLYPIAASVSAKESEELKAKILVQIINEKMMLKRAAELGITVNDGELEERVAEIKNDYKDTFTQYLDAQKVDFHEWREELRNRLILAKLITREVNDRISVSDEEIKQYYKLNRKTFTSQEKVHVLQIVVREEDKAEKIWNRLKQHEEFAKVAREFSIGPEASKGGDLGFFPRGVMPEEIDSVVFKLRPGNISNVIQSPYGYHIFKVLEREGKGSKPLAKLKEGIAAEIKKQKEESSYLHWLESLRKKTKVNVNDSILKETKIP